MKASGPQAPSGGFSLQDILFILFRHKWKIILLTMLGLAGAAVVYFTREPLYQSRAKLLVRYVFEVNRIDHYESKVDPGPQTGGHVIEAEAEILTSEDLAREVAETLGAERLLGRAGATVPEAAFAVLKDLQVSNEPGSSVLHVTYTSGTPEVCQEVLSELIQRYFVRHLEIHRSTGAFEFVAKQAEMARSRLRQAEDELNKFKAESGILSLKESMDSLESRRSELRSEVLRAQTELAAQQAKVQKMESVLGLKGEGVLVKPQQPGAAAAPVDESERRAASKALVEYQGLARDLESFQRQRTELLQTLAPTNRRIQSLDRQIATIKAQGLALLERYPELAGAAHTSSGGEAALPAPATDIDAERALLAACQARATAAAEQAAQVEKEVERASKVGAQLEALERRKRLEEEKAGYLESSLDKARVDEALDPTKMPNISMVQEPSTPREVFGKSMKRLLMGLAGGGFALGVGLAFLIEMVIDRRIRRPVEISARLQLPLLMTIPYFRRLRDGAGALLPYHAGDDAGDRGAALIVPPAPGDERRPAPGRGSGDFIVPYMKAIRDRIVFNFEVNNVLHRPKLVALAGLSDNAGTSTLASGVARAFAESDGMKVLLVDLNPQRQGAKGANGHAGDSLDKVLRLAEGNHLGGKLVVANAGAPANGHGPSGLEPMQLYGLIPKLQASDFDYIIFDMPPIGPTSPTLAMAGFMDKVLLVLDAENTSREELVWGYSELSRGKADVSCIYNKARSHAPRWVEGGV